jgi:hypothetical protein
VHVSSRAARSSIDTTESMEHICVMNLGHYVTYPDSIERSSSFIDQHISLNDEVTEVQDFKALSRLIQRQIYQGYLKIFTSNGVN